MLMFWRYLLKVSPGIPLQSIFRSSSQQAEEINRLTNYFFIAAGFILLVVIVLTALVVYKFRDGKEASTDAPPLSKKWEIATIGVPTVLVLIFLYLNIKTIIRVEPAVNGRTPDIIITAHQWWWQANYPSTNAVAANEIHLPAGKKLLLKLLSADVIHDWWVPQLGNKMDMVPNHENYLWLTIKKPGVYYGTCSEFCGDQHAHMRIKVIAENEADYNNWMQAHAQPSSGDTLQTGAQLFVQITCGNCHRIKGTRADGNAGPDLTHLGSRQTLLAGLLENNQQNLEDWIRHPQQVKPGANMPDFHLNDTTVRDIAAYLHTLK